MSDSILSAIQSPFQRLRDLLGDDKPGARPIDMTIGEPRHGVPAFTAEIIEQTWKSFGRYPPIAGIPELRAAISGWLSRRYGLAPGLLDADRNILPLCGTREGLVSALSIAAALKRIGRAAVLMPNPFYQAYYAAALTSGCEPVLLPATAATGFLPDLAALDSRLLDRTAAFYVASPANPQGSIASSAYFETLIGLARKHGFFVFSDECYSEIYQNEPPCSALGLAACSGSFERVLIFNSLSKRSNAPGLRSGFIAGDGAFLQHYCRYRNVAAPQVPVPLQHASAALWADEDHVAQSRALYRQKIASASKSLRELDDYREPPGGFFLWLDMARFGGGERAAVTLWKGYGVKILPGAYLAKPGADGINPAENYARLALVDSLDVTREALDRLASSLS